VSELRFGIIGCGDVVQQIHLPAWRLAGGATLVAVCDSSPEALQRVTLSYPRVRQYKDAQTFLDDSGDLDFVVLATPGSTHLEIGRKVLERRKHLLCEKPLALDAESARQLYRIAEEQGVVLMPIHNYRYRDTVARALAYARRGELGDIAYVGLRFRTGSLFDEPGPWRRKEAQERVLLFDLGFHFIDLALLFAGPVRELHFVHCMSDSMGLQYVAFGTFHDRGTVGFFELMRDASSCSTQLEIFGEKGALVLDFFPDGFRRLPIRDTPVHRAVSEIRRGLDYIKATLAEQLLRRPPKRVWGHAVLFSQFVEALRGQRPVPVPKQEVLQVIDLLDRVAKQAYGRAYDDSSVSKVVS
jgi:predicted dehydrogenase